MNFKLQEIVFQLSDNTLSMGQLLLIVLAISVPWVWSIVYIARTRTEEPTDRIVWLLVVLFLGLLGTILYLCFGKEKASVEVSSPDSDSTTFDEWLKDDPARKYLSPEDQRKAFSERT